MTGSAKRRPAISCRESRGMGNLPKASAPLDVLQNIIQNTERHFSSLPIRKGRTPLHLAAWCGADEVVEILAEKCPEAAGVMDRT